MSVLVPLSDVRLAHERAPMAHFFTGYPLLVNYSTKRSIDCFTFLCGSSHSIYPHSITGVGLPFRTSTLTLAQHAVLAERHPSTVLALTNPQYSELQRLLAQ
jgi:hypothetical protein